MKESLNAEEFYRSLTESQKKELSEALLKDEQRESFSEYLKATIPNYVEHSFNSALALMCEWAVKERLEKGLPARILVSCPPRSGKSMTVSESLPSWFLGRNPDSVCAIVGYSADKAQDFGDKNRKKVKDFGNEIFGISVSDRKDNLTQFGLNGHEGYCLSVGIGGGITGKTGRFRLIIVDDPYKNGEEAESPKIREQVYNTFMDSVMTRLDPKGSAIIVIHTRWNEDDLIGKLQKLGGWESFNVPAVCEDPGRDAVMHRKKGEVLDCGADFTPEYFETMRRMIGERNWNALYQGNPSPDSGGLFDRGMFTKQWGSLSELPNDLSNWTISLDSSYKEKTDSDKSAITVWAHSEKEKCHYLMDISNQVAGFSTTCSILRQMCAKYPKCMRILVEAKANGEAIIESLKNDGFIGVTPIEPQGGKYARAQASVPFFSCGSVSIPSSEMNRFSIELIDQFIRFPNCKNDDLVDSCTQYLNSINQLSGGRIDLGEQYTYFAKLINGRK